MDRYTWVFDNQGVDWQELSDLYRAAPLGIKSPGDLEIVFNNSMFTCFVYHEGRLIGAGRALADGLDCAYLADVAVRPEQQGAGLGKAIIGELLRLSAGHKKVILYANPGTEGFYTQLGFLRMKTAMGIWGDREGAIAAGLLGEA